MLASSTLGIFPDCFPVPVVSSGTCRGAEALPGASAAFRGVEVRLVPDPAG